METTLVRPSASLFKKTQDLQKTSTHLIEILKSRTKIKPKENDFFLISDCLSFIKEEEPDLRYLNSFHIIECFLKDPKRRLIINGSDFIKIKKVNYVRPPDVLYFGTLDHLVDSMKIRGISSNTKGYIKLHDSIQKAEEFASKFIKTGLEKICVLTVDAGKGFEEGLIFSTHIEHEYIVREIPKKYIIT